MPRPWIEEPLFLLAIYCSPDLSWHDVVGK